LADCQAITGVPPLRRDLYGHRGGLCCADPSAALNGGAMSGASRKHWLKRHRYSPRRHL